MSWSDGGGDLTKALQRLKSNAGRSPTNRRSPRPSHWQGTPFRRSSSRPAAPLPRATTSPHLDPDTPPSEDALRTALRASHEVLLQTLGTIRDMERQLEIVKQQTAQLAAMIGVTLGEDTEFEEEGGDENQSGVIEGEPPDL